jgi:hypothetical protein
LPGLLFTISGAENVEPPSVLRWKTTSAPSPVLLLEYTT